MPPSADDPHDVAFLHDDQVFTVDLDLGARPFAEQDVISRLHVERRDAPALRARPAADGDAFAFLRLFLRRIGDDDPARSLLLGLQATDENAVMKWTECHS